MIRRSDRPPLDSRYHRTQNNEGTDALDGADPPALMASHDEFAELSPEGVRERMRGDLVVDAKGLTDETWSDAGLQIKRV